MTLLFTLATTTRYCVFGFGGCVRRHASCLSLNRYSSSFSSTPLSSSVTNENEASSTPSNTFTVPRKFVPFPFQVRTYGTIQ